MMMKGETALMLGIRPVYIDTNGGGAISAPARLKDCLTRNQDVLSPQCKNDYGRAFDAIQKRVTARAAVTKLCDRDVAKFCAGSKRGATPKALISLWAGLPEGTQN